MSDRLSLVFNALADPPRRAILPRLLDGDATVNELAAPLPMSLPAVSRHLKVLETAGLISRSRDAQWRRSSLEVEPLQEVLDWMEPYRRVLGDHPHPLRTPPPPPPPRRA